MPTFTKKPATITASQWFKDGLKRGVELSGGIPLEGNRGATVAEKPILFSAPMIRALLNGRKTQTRRVVKPQPGEGIAGPMRCERYSPTVYDRYGDAQPGPKIFGAFDESGEWGARCPYGEPGDRLWVKETFWAFGRWETRFSGKKGRDEWRFIDMTVECGKDYLYEADDPRPQPKAGKRDGGVTPKWWNRPAIFMPRAASRILLGIDDVRVEQLQDIGEEDAIAEGGERLEHFPTAPWWHGRHGPVGPCLYTTARMSFQYLWESINGPESWAANPWVWVVEFQRAKAPS